MAEIHDILGEEPLTTVVIENNGDICVSNATITGGDGTVVEVLAFDRGGSGSWGFRMLLI